MISLLTVLLRCYQLLISPVIHALCGPGCGCRYEPRCSEYMIQALRTHGLLHGLRFGLLRIARCQPWGGCGYDPVPEIFKPTQ
jgi:hypothetical protein